MAYCPRCGSTLSPGISSCPTCGLAVAAETSAARPSVAAAAPAPSKKSNKLPWILGGAIGCGCLGIPVLGILAAIIIPNYVDAQEKSRVKRTMADLHQVQSALLAFSIDQMEDGASLYPEVETVADLQPLLVPEYASKLPLLDGWGNALRYQCWNDGSEGSTGCNTFRVASGGRDGELAVDDLSYFVDSWFDPKEFDEDIVLGAEGFVRYPRSESE